MTDEAQDTGSSLSEAIVRLFENYDASESPDPKLEGDSVRATLELFAQSAPGHSVEVRVPPYGAVQAIEGTRHRRGTPPASIECDARTWLELATGRLRWDEAIEDGRVDASGHRADLGEWLPVALP